MDQPAHLGNDLVAGHGLARGHHRGSSDSRQTCAVIEDMANQTARGRSVVEPPATASPQISSQSVTECLCKDSLSLKKHASCVSRPDHDNHERFSVEAFPCFPFHGLSFAKRQLTPEGKGDRHTLANSTPVVISRVTVL